MKRTLWIDGLAAAVLLFGIFAYNGIAAAGEGEACLECHGDSATVGTALTIDQAAFAATPHAALGCLACHEGVGADHPDDGAKPPKAQCGNMSRDCRQGVCQLDSRRQRGLRQIATTPTQSGLRTRFPVTI